MRGGEKNPELSDLWDINSEFWRGKKIWIAICKEFRFWKCWKIFSQLTSCNSDFFLWILSLHIAILVFLFHNKINAHYKKKTSMTFYLTSLPFLLFWIYNINARNKIIIKKNTELSDLRYIDSEFWESLNYHIYKLSSDFAKLLLFSQNSEFTSRISDFFLRICIAISQSLYIAILFWVSTMQ